MKLDIHYTVALLSLLVMLVGGLLLGVYLTNYAYEPVVEAYADFGKMIFVGVLMSVGSIAIDEIEGDRHE